ncbi:hypothetical protein EQO05_06030 [Methanosarcina sp. MSH10X1]|uniref:hypothetical protein n=1 Tax=Methanosarcina sp. MSH10X1 TaxID=2507075 RepID=UPI000FFB4728|nr:hypothetical protein [Methanosarcina sp. MSH10X1]RXA20142.1 hypothetical protein EQO05_06030 [Methanosarcina sp. MSH10X1]
MGLPIKIIYVFLIFVLLTSCEAATENKDMPTEEEVTTFIDNFEAPESGDFISSAYDAFIEEYPAGHCDVWSNGMISFYYYDPNSPKEYGAIYLGSNGDKAKPGGTGTTYIKSYEGEYDSEKNTPVDPIPASIQEQPDTAQEQHVTAQEEPDMDDEQQVTVQEQYVTVQEQYVTGGEQPAKDEEQPVTREEQPTNDEESFWKDPIISGITATVVGALILKVIRC